MSLQPGNRRTVLGDIMADGIRELQRGVHRVCEGYCERRSHPRIVFPDPHQAEPVSEIRHVLIGTKKRLVNRQRLELGQVVQISQRNFERKVTEAFVVRRAGDRDICSAGNTHDRSLRETPVHSVRR